ncbi:MAG: hypothetical protein QOF02_1306 [Blastocatellia bacterium]|jgi:hypothetical protein|nr:hypothetical protein [Blastocatellia bacterium]
MSFRLPIFIASLLLTTTSNQCGLPSKSVSLAQQLKPRDAALASHTAAAVDFTAADFEQHIAHLKKQFTLNEFTFVVQSPFVVIGDEPAATVRQRAAETVKWTIDLLRKDYFKKNLPLILNIWLFKDTDSYQRHARQLFNDEPDTPYGYYSSANRALVMNIETGSGTLVHELVHPFMDANFPACPPWFNEGLASLYEQSGEVDGHLHGYPNWRLPALKLAIKASAVPSFKSLMEMNAEAFYRQDKGTNYAQSRYLCYYLQERGLLAEFYSVFTANQSTDPTGYLSLQKVLGESDLPAFQKKWEKFVLDIKEGFTVRTTSN